LVRGGSLFKYLPVGIPRKIVLVIFGDIDDETILKDKVMLFIMVLKEAMVGLFIAFLIASAFMVCDHAFSLRLPTARTFRKAAHRVMKDPETLRSFEENAGIKLMEMDMYESMTKELAEKTKKTDSSALKRREKELNDARRETAQIREKVDGMVRKLGLERFCGDCIWKGSVTCSERVQALRNKHMLNKWKSQISAMQTGSCIRAKAGSAEARKQELHNLFADYEDKEELDVNDVVKNWSKHHHNFCGDCEWETGMRCSTRATYLNEQYSTPIIEAMAKVMVETERCRNDYYEAKIAKMGGFCGGCVWGHKISQTCNARVEYLVYTYRNPTLVAQLAAMDKPACRGWDK